MVFLLAFLPILLRPSTTAAQCTDLGHSGPTLAETVELVPGEGLPPRVLRDAIAAWARCANYGRGFPAFVVGERGSRSD